MSLSDQNVNISGWQRHPMKQRCARTYESVVDLRTDRHDMVKKDRQGFSKSDLIKRWNWMKHVERPALASYAGVMTRRVGVFAGSKRSTMN